MTALLASLALAIVAAAPTASTSTSAGTAAKAASGAAWPDAGRLSAGGTQTCMVADDATVWCWGSNRGGERGDGTTEPRPAPTQVPGLTEVTAVASGDKHTCALRRDRSVECWGMRTLWRPPKFLPDLAKIARKKVEGLGPADALVAAGGRTCALVRGEVWCWGAINWEKVQDTPERRFGLTGVEELVMEDGFLCARKGGQVLCAAPDPNTWKIAATVTPLADIQDAVGLASGGDHVCVLRASGRVVCMGQLEYPEIDRRDFKWLRQTEIKEITNAVRLMPSGHSHVCAELAEGEVRCWGSAGDGQLGNGLVQPWRRPVAVVGLRSPRAMAGGWGHTCAISRDREVLCWGRNESGQAGTVELSVTVPELTPDPRSGKDSIAGQMRGLLRQRHTPAAVMSLDGKSLLRR